MAVRLADVSSYQGHPDWPAAEGELAGGICKATEGLTYTDPTFSYNWHAIRGAGLVRGTYHFARPSPWRLPSAEADRFLSVIALNGGLGPGDLPPILDLEASVGLTPAALRLWTRRFCDRIRQRTGRSAIIYTGAWFWNPRVGGSDNFGCPLWLSAYAPDPRPYVPHAWRDWTLWQFTDGQYGPQPHTVSGIGHCDISVFNGRRDQLRHLAGLDAPPPPRPSPPPRQSPPPEPSHPRYGGRVLRPGDRGAAVRTWQEQMRRRGWRLAADGVFGPQTERVVREFQREKKLAVDGLIGPRTWDAAWAAPVT